MKLAVAQFEPRSGDKNHNLKEIECLCSNASSNGAEVISFHEMCLTGYTFTKDLSYIQLQDLAEEIPSGQSIKTVIEIAKKFDIAILFGLLEKEHNNIFNTYVCVDKNGIIGSHRKLHPFINSHLTAGDSYTVFELNGWKCGILICYDNNVIENVRATTLLGAELIFGPHVTCCTPSSFPGSGFVDHAIWEHRKKNPEALRKEFDGPKGRGWLMTWLPARAYDNGVYYAFSNPIGYDGSHLKNGNSMIIDPYGQVIAEVKSFESDFVVIEIDKALIHKSGGKRYLKARRPDLYSEIISKKNASETNPSWLKKSDQ